MVKNISFLILLFASLTSQAKFLVGVSSYSWQEVLPVTYTDQTSGLQVNDARLATFSTLGLNIGYERLLAPRWLGSTEIVYQTGTVDFQTLSAYASPRKYTQTIFLNSKLNYRISKVFSIGPELWLNYNNIQTLGSGLNFSGLFNLDYNILYDTKIVQTFGTTGGSGTLSYSIGLYQEL